MTILFFTRLTLYFVGLALPIFHPAIAIPYDNLGWYLWFVLIPGEMLIAFYLSPPRFRLRTQLITASVFLFIGFGIMLGSGSPILLTLIGGVVAFLSTGIIFHSKGRLRTLALGELFFFGYHYTRLINFSRGSESIARDSSGITQILLILCIGSFLVHSLVIYLATFREGVRRRNFKEIGTFITVSVLAGLLLVFLLPSDFVRHSVVFNRLAEPINPDLVPLDFEGGARTGGNLRGDNEADSEDQARGGTAGEKSGEKGEEGEEGTTNRLEGLPSDQWNSQRIGQGLEEGKQYAVMVVASNRNPVYAADRYYELFDSVRGFRPNPENELNELTFIRLLETWSNPGHSPDGKRESFSISFLSTIPDRVLAYEPRSVRPTVLDRTYHPFDYSYTSESDISVARANDWGRIRGLTREERVQLDPFLEIPLSSKSREIFQAYLDSIRNPGDGYYDLIEGILRSYANYQYEIGFNDEVSVERMAEFVTESKQGDCTEFSNTTAILARLAGIPARVVTGYLASKDLQTDAHKRGILTLLEAIEPLRAFTPDELYLITTSHRHSWVQLYMPGYGWTDFETTSYAIPPVNGDPSTMDVVIPIIEAKPNPIPTFKFPWLLLARLLVILVFSGMLVAYLFRYGRELALRIVAKGSDSKALNAVYRLALMRLAAEGLPIKAPSRTALEYAEEHPQFYGFAEVYTQLRYRETFPPHEKEQIWKNLRESYQNVVKESQRGGILGFLRRIISLKSLYY